MAKLQARRWSSCVRCAPGHQTAKSQSTVLPVTMPSIHRFKKNYWQTQQQTLLNLVTGYSTSTAASFQKVEKRESADSRTYANGCDTLTHRFHQRTARSISDEHEAHESDEKRSFSHVVGCHGSSSSVPHQHRQPAVDGAALPFDARWHWRHSRNSCPSLQQQQQQQPWTTAIYTALIQPRSRHSSLQQR